jgi:hypothetical protein
MTDGADTPGGAAHPKATERLIWGETHGYDGAQREGCTPCGTQSPGWSRYPLGWVSVRLGLVTLG